MAKYEKSFKGNFDLVLKLLDDEIIESAVSMECVDSSDYCIGDINVSIRVYDKHFYRNGNRASLNLTLIGKEDDLFVCAIGSGGGSGVFFNFSWGAEESMTSLVEKILEDY